MKSERIGGEALELEWGVDVALRSQPRITFLRGWWWIWLLPETAWTPAWGTEGYPGEFVDVAELSGILPQLSGSGWPPGLRVLARRERPIPMPSATRSRKSAGGATAVWLPIHQATRNSGPRATCGALDAIRTRGLPLRRRSLYPPELRGRVLNVTGRSPAQASTYTPAGAGFPSGCTTHHNPPCVATLWHFTSPGPSST